MSGTVDSHASPPTSTSDAQQPLAARVRWLVIAAAAAAGVYFVFIWERGVHPLHSFDTYMYYYPNMLYGLRALRDGGKGLLWTALQDCGEPFFGISSTALLYPANIFFLFLDPDLALRAVVAFNLTIAGVSAFLLCREIGLGTIAALCGALAFELSNAAVDVSTWQPIVGGAYAWLPAGLLLCERLLRAPTFGRAVGLGVVLSFALLSGFPQTVFFIYQLIALRVVWEFITRRPERPLAVLGFLALGLALPPLLTAFQLVPGAEMARLSVRGTPLTLYDIQGQGFLGWKYFRNTFGLRRELFNPILIVPAMIASLSIMHVTGRRHVAFYSAVALLSFLLSFGMHTPVFALYAMLPGGKLFREPARFLWVTGFCLSVLTAFGVDALVRRLVPATAGGRYATAALPVLAVMALFFLSPYGFNGSEWAITLIAIVAVAVACMVPRLQRAAAAVAVGAVVFNLLAFPWAPPPKPNWLALRPWPFRSLLPSGDVFYKHSALFQQLGRWMTPQDRAYFVHPTQSFALEPKSASVFGVPSIQGYEPQPSLRYAEYWVMMRRNEEYDSLGSFYYLDWGPSMLRVNRRLFDLTGARFVVVDVRSDRTKVLMDPNLTFRFRSGRGLRVYENPQAFPRAFFVPRVEVVASSRTLLYRLAFGEDDLRQVALVEERPPSGFTGLPATNATGTVEFTRNDPEDVALRVQAPARGFLFLADQYFPGWHATVNGTQVPIMRANHLFRLIEVPQGESVVEFRYAPRSIWVGAAVSAFSIIGLGVAGILQLRRR